MKIDWARVRVELFLKVCAALQFAHGRLVLHRDLKPFNVLVTPQGVVKLLDFDVAKILGDQGSEATDPTRFPLTLTLSYAAPEQLRGERAPACVDGTRAQARPPTPVGPGGNRGAPLAIDALRATVDHYEGLRYPDPDGLAASR